MNYTNFDGCTPEFISISDVVQHEENMRESVSSNLEDPITQIIEGAVDITPNISEDPLSIPPDVKSCLYSCDQCRESFVQLSDYQAHLSVHINTRAFPCTLCERRFVRKNKLTLHMRIHTGEKPFVCTVCGRCFSRNDKLKNHRMTHTGEKPFDCTECGRSFSRKDKLKNHRKTHTGEKPHQCILCQKNFSRKDKMKNHMQSQHQLALVNLDSSVAKTEVKPEQKESVNNGKEQTVRKFLK